MTNHVVDLATTCRVTDQFFSEGFETLDRKQFERLITTLNPAFTVEDAQLLADRCFNMAYTGSDRMCSKAFVDWLFEGSIYKFDNEPPSKIIMGDLGSGKTSVYVFERSADGGMSVTELADGENPDLPSLANTDFGDWCAAFQRAAGDYIDKLPVHIGATEWYRKLPNDTQVELGLKLWKWGEGHKSGFRLLYVPGLREAHCEAIACRHACERVLQFSPGLILASGTGSMQCTTRADAISISIDTASWSKKTFDDIPAYLEVVREALQPIKPLLQAEGQAALMIGAAWYGIVAVGMASQKSEPFQMPRLEALRLLQEGLKQSDMTMRNAVNIWRLIEALQLLNADVVIFARTWIVNGKTFRTTWATGYFLEGCM